MHVETRQLLRFSVWLHIFHLHFARRRIEIVQTLWSTKNRTINRLSVQFPLESCSSSFSAVGHRLFNRRKVLGFVFRGQTQRRGVSASWENFGETVTVPAAFPFFTGRLFSVDRGENRLETRLPPRSISNYRENGSEFCSFFRLCEISSRCRANRQTERIVDAIRLAGAYTYIEKEQSELTAHRKLTCGSFIFFVRMYTAFFSFIRVIFAFSLSVRRPSDFWFFQLALGSCGVFYQRWNYQSFSRLVSSQFFPMKFTSKYHIVFILKNCLWISFDVQQFISHVFILI